MGLILDYTKSNLKASNCKMRTILFETHHLYYLPNFFPIVDEFRKRGNYDIQISMPQYINTRERDLFKSVCDNLDLSIINAEDEESRIEKILSIQFDVIFQQNRKEHVSACRNASEYKVDIIYVDKDETQHSTAVVPASIDGAGLTRAYNHRIRVVRSAFLMIILLTNKTVVTCLSTL